MTRKALWLLPASLAALAASQWKDIARLLKIQQMSRGTPNPASAPVSADAPALVGDSPKDATPGTGQRNRAL